MTVNDPQVIAWAVGAPRTVAVVGLSDKPDRPSYHVAEELQKRGYKVVPVTPKGEEILGEKVYRSLAEIPFPVEIVQIFRAPQYALEVVQEIERMVAKPKVVWMQEGVVNEEAVAAATAMGLEPVQDLCLYKAIQQVEG